MLDVHVKQPDGEQDPFECVVLDVQARVPGFYTAAWRTYYVAGAGTVYLLRAPGQRATLLQLDDVPDGADPDPNAGRDRVLRHLADAVEALARPVASVEGRA
jgi:hypothetical protein